MKKENHFDDDLNTIDDLFKETEIEEFNNKMSEECLSFLALNYGQNINKLTNGRYIYNVKAILLYSIFADGGNTERLMKQCSDSEKFKFDVDMFEQVTELQSHRVEKIRHFWSFDVTKKPLINYIYLFSTYLNTYHITISVDANGHNSFSEDKKAKIKVIKSINSSPETVGEMKLDKSGITLFEIEHYGDANYIEFDHDLIFDSDNMSISLLKNLRRMTI